VWSYIGMQRLMIPARVCYATYQIVAYRMLHKGQAPLMTSVQGIYGSTAHAHYCPLLAATHALLARQLQLPLLATNRCCAAHVHAGLCTAAAADKAAQAGVHPPL
jgi:hypothetical protein